jgi:hypothetical protein
VLLDAALVECSSSSRSPFERLSVVQKAFVSHSYKYCNAKNTAGWCSNHLFALFYMLLEPLPLVSP